MDKTFSLTRLKGVTKLLVWQSDTTTIRVVLALSSLLFGINLLVESKGLDRPGFSLMWQLMPPEAWAGLLILHFIGLSWRFLDPVKRVSWALAINSLGLLVWLLSTLAINLSTWRAYGTMSPSTSLELVVCMFAAWALLRTGSRDELLNA